jgi:putative DNA primase/helicase
MSGSDRLADIADVALAAFHAGICVVPAKEDGSKTPIVELVRLDGEDEPRWTSKHWQQARPSAEKLQELFSKSRRSGISFICGKVSGNLELIDFDDRETYEAFTQAAAALGLDELVERVEAGYLEETPSGGIHWFTRCAQIAGNTKLARRPKRPEEMKDPSDKVKVLIETRGESGQAVVAPSNGRVHPSGRPYRLLRGGAATIATITPEERAELWKLARSFDQMPKPAFPEPLVQATATAERPGDDFNERANWTEILQPHGWTPVYHQGDKTLWRRPGTESHWSASTNYNDSDLFYCKLLDRTYSSRAAPNSDALAAHSRTARQRCSR